LIVNLHEVEFKDIRVEIRIGVWNTLDASELIHEDLRDFRNPLCLVVEKEVFLSFIKLVDAITRGV
jgi:hypothetical protein